MFASDKQDEFAQIAPKQRARVEPKSYFANERTFIQWISAALLQVTVAVILLEYASHHPEYPLVSVGLLLCGAAGIVLTYALFNYHRRVKLLNTGSPYGYIDYMGPTFLALTIVVGIVAITVIVAQGPPSATLLPMAFVREEAGLCAQQSSTGLSNLEYEPSDIVFDTQRGLMLVPSLSTVKAYTIASSASGILDVTPDQPNIAAKTLVDVPGSNMEGLTYAGDRVFALSESVRNPTDPSELIELKWVSTAADAQGQGGDESNSTSDFKLELVQRWSIPTPQAEGIAFVPDSFGSSGKLYIAGDNGPNPTTGLNTDRGSIDVYDLPTISQQQLQPSSTLSSKTLNQGLSDSKIASLQYFEGLLYVLHDNVIGVRVWDLTKGEIMAEWRLPMVGGGFEKQWEGMWLQRHKVEAIVTRRGLRGSDGTALIDNNSSVTTDSESTSKLILHLALDTPAEVWSFAVEEGASPGQILLPLCAAA